MFLKMTVEKLAVVASLKRAVAVLLIGWLSNMKWDMTTGTSYHVVNGDKITRS